jgi:hypothetical protein
MPRGGRTRAPAFAATNGREAQRRARARLTERRRQQDRLIDAVLDALAARRSALAALTRSRTSLDDALVALAERGIGPDELATMLDLPASELSGPALGHRGRGTPTGVQPPTATATGAVNIAFAEGEDNPVRIWLAMIERGSAPKTHGLDQDGWLLCRGTGDPEHLVTWIGYAFDVDCQRCAKLLAQQLTDEEFG